MKGNQATKNEAKGVTIGELTTETENTKGATQCELRNQPKPKINWGVTGKLKGISKAKGT